MDDKCPELNLENQLCFPLYAASRLTTKLYTPLLNELDLTYPQYLVLLTLWQHDNLSVKEIGKKLYLESNTLTPLIKRLAEKKIILKERSANDERTVIISLTDKGKRLKTKAKNVPLKMSSIFSDLNLSAVEIVSFRDQLNDIVKELESRLS